MESGLRPRSEYNINLMQFETYKKFLYDYLKKGFFFGIERELSLLLGMKHLIGKETPIIPRLKMIFIKTIVMIR